MGLFFLLFWVCFRSVFWQNLGSVFLDFGSVKTIGGTAVPVPVPVFVPVHLPVPVPVSSTQGGVSASRRSPGLDFS